jgi:hypothetical protein
VVGGGRKGEGEGERGKGGKGERKGWGGESTYLTVWPSEQPCTASMPRCIHSGDPITSGRHRVTTEVSIKALGNDLRSDATWVAHRECE